MKIQIEYRKNFLIVKPTFKKERSNNYAAKGFLLHRLLMMRRVSPVSHWLLVFREPNGTIIFLQQERPGRPIFYKMKMI